MMGDRELDIRFSHHPPKDDDAVARFQNIRRYARNFAEMVDDSVLDGREKSLAITKIEEAVFWANAGIAREVEK